MGGDFNTTSWMPLHEEWLQEAGVIVLIDPSTPTYSRGTAIDKYLFVPGTYLPSSLLPPAAESHTEITNYVDSPHYPAEIIEYTQLSGHFPILLPVPCDAAPQSNPKDKCIRSEGLTEETWTERNMEFARVLEDKWPKQSLIEPLVNITRRFSIF